MLRTGGRLAVVDIKRATNGLSRAILAALAHAGLQEGVQDLPLLLR